MWIKLNIREIKYDELDKLLELYKHLHDNDSLPEPYELSKVWDEIQGNKNIKYFGAFGADERISSCFMNQPVLTETQNRHL
jgi:hypothetical protein